MANIDAKHFGVEEFKSLYSSEEMTTAFWWKIGLSNIRHKEYVTLESSYEEEMVNMASLDGSLTPYFYLHLVIHDFGILIPFGLFEVDLLPTANVVSSQVTPNV